MTICSLKNLNTSSLGTFKTFSNNFFQANKKVLFILEILMNIGSFHSFHLNFICGVKDRRIQGKVFFGPFHENHG